VTVEHVVSFKPYTQQQVLNTAAALELHSEHRFARAIVSFARSMGALGFQRVTDAVEEPGAGITGTLNGKSVLVGSVAFTRKNKINVPEAAMLHAEEGKTIVLVAADRIVFGYIALVEATKEETARVVQSIHRDGKQVVLLSGDHKLTAEAHAKAVGITEVIADATPAKKAVAYQKLRADGRVVASVANDVRVDAAVSLVVFTPRTKPSIVDKADILIRSDDLSTLEALSSALADETRARRVVPRTAWITGGVALALACVGFGGLLAAPVLYFGAAAAVNAARSHNTLEA
jgi:Cu+-exporting ATPase